jgi:hypothetical protein
MLSGRLSHCERLCKQDIQLIWIRWFLGYLDPHNEYFGTFYDVTVDPDVIPVFTSVSRRCRHPITSRTS